MFEVEDEDNDNEVAAVINRYDTATREGATRRAGRRRGAPFKGNVSNNKVEKFKP